MVQKDIPKQGKEKRILWLKLSIVVLGYFVIFGLGFALGLNYAQNLYLVPQKSNDLQSENKKEGLSENMSFYYKLTEKKRPEKNISIDREEKQKVTQKEGVEQDFGYTIQVYSFKSDEISDQMISELKKKGYPAYQSTIDLGKSGIFYRVRVGQFKNRSDAMELLEEICASENKEAFITRY